MSPTPPLRQPGAVAGAGAAFKVRKDSHSIHKQATTSPPSSSSTNSSVSSSSNAAVTTSSNAHRPATAPPPAPRKKHHPQPQRQTQQSVIIYTQSPKVVHTNPRNFMSIVQKLTGLDSTGPTAARGASSSSPAPAARVNAGPISAAAAAAQDESSSSSSESCAAAHAAAGPPPPPYYADSQLMPPPAAPLLDAAHFMAPGDMPLFAAPDAAELHRQLELYGQFPAPVHATAAAACGPVMAATTVNGGAGGGSNGGALLSPSMVEAMRTFHQGYN
ncbi:hypothetical protein HU200_041994 [Digitaria exilis]|uniref:VQ domain-containing protein n=1 Tax=Digitaria exilis TaxID=1010633 RepID=A0A835EIN8_9POAL|nr:hypothetical protein HU200_041994 [Digitaria exilis]